MARTWGSTVEERAQPYPCDRVLADPDLVCWRAVDVAAPASVVFRWLCQLRAAPYSYDWVDNFGRRSPRVLTEGLDDLAVGQRFMRLFELSEFEPDRHVTLVLTSGRPLFGELALTYAVAPVNHDSCRLLVKLLATAPATGPLRWLYRHLMPAADLVMMRKQLLTLKALAESDVAP